MKNDPGVGARLVDLLDIVDSGDLDHAAELGALLQRAHLSYALASVLGQDALVLVVLELVKLVESLLGQMVLVELLLHGALDYVDDLLFGDAGLFRLRRYDALRSQHIITLCVFIGVLVVYFFRFQLSLTFRVVTRNI